MKKITITGCSICPHKDHRGAFAKVSYVPVCSLSGKTIPHDTGLGVSNIVVASLAADFIPEWCELDDDTKEN